jgi:hypothetical protein
MNAHDELLEWASEIGSGSWRLWREAAAYLGLEPNAAARELSALGHVEFDWLDNRFACAPSTAVLTLRSSGCLLLTGSRRRGLRAYLEELWEEGDYDVDVRPPVPQLRGPETWLVEAEMAELERFCADGGFELHIDSGRRLAAALPPATLEAIGLEERPDDRFPRKWFDPDPRFRCFRVGDSSGSDDGLWWVEEHRRDVGFVRRDGRWWRIPTREYGPYVAYPDQSFITYHESLGFLTVDNATPLPPLVARSATLQSGRLPKREGASRHTYVNIDHLLVELIETHLDAYVNWK